jgi:ATP-binding protein involved in chromosome partitioning
MDSVDNAGRPLDTDAFERRIEEYKQLKERMGRVRYKIAVMSGKGGVGKSLITVNLAAALASEGRRVGILDADLHGPTVPKMIGLKGARLEAGDGGIIPPTGLMGIKVASMDFLLPSQDSPVIWRGPLKMAAIRQLLSEVDWGDLDYLLIDLPPGTGDEALSILQLLQVINGVVIVTIPNEVSGQVVEKSVTFARQMKAPVIGIVENMSYLICPHCGERIELFGEGVGQKIAMSLGAPFLGSIPLDPNVARESDTGTPFVAANPQSVAAKAFKEIVTKIEKFVEGTPPTY